MQHGNTTGKVICSPWLHPSGMQEHKLNPSQHQHIINPHTWLYWKSLVSVRVCWNNIATPLLTETHWLCNLFLSQTPCRLLIINTIYEVRADGYYLHEWGTFGKGEPGGWGRNWRHIVLMLQNMEALRLPANKSCNKQACDRTTVIYISATRRVPSAIVIFITGSTTTRSWPSARCEHQRRTHWAH